MGDNKFDFILTLYIGFLLIYAIHPQPKILYKKVFPKSKNHL
jgi:hypothetical protein